MHDLLRNLTVDYNLLWHIYLSKIVQILDLKFEKYLICWVDKRQTKDYNGMLRVHILNLPLWVC